MALLNMDAFRASVAASQAKNKAAGVVNQPATTTNPFNTTRLAELAAAKSTSGNLTNATGTWSAGPGVPITTAATTPGAAVPTLGAAAPQSTPQQSGYQSSYKGPDISGMTQQLKDIYANRQASELQKLRDARDTALQGYNSQETTAKQGAYDSRNQADTTNLQNAQALREQMANGGLVGDGQNLTLQAGLNAQRLGALGAINRQENNAMQDISQKRSLLQNNAAANELGLTQQINSDQAAALYDLAKYGDTRNFDVDNVNYGRYRDDVNQQFARDQFDYGKTQDQIQNDAQFGGTYNGNRTFAAQQAKIANDANYAGTYGGNMTVGQRQQVADNKFRLGMATGTLSNGQQTLDNRQFQEGIRQNDRNYDRGVLESDRNYKYQAGRDKVGDAQWNKEFQNRVAQDGISNAIAWANHTLSASNSAADNARQDAQFAYNKQQDAQQGSDLNGTINTLNKLYLGEDTATGNTVVSNPDALRKAILSKKLSDDETDQLLSYYGLPTN